MHRFLHVVNFLYQCTYVAETKLYSHRIAAAPIPKSTRTLHPAQFPHTKGSPAQLYRSLTQLPQNLPQNTKQTAPTAHCIALSNPRRCPPVPSPHDSSMQASCMHAPAGTQHSR